MINEKKFIEIKNNVIHVDFRRKGLLIPQQKQLEENINELYIILQELRLSRQEYSNKKLLAMVDELIIETEKELEQSEQDYIKLIKKYLAIRQEQKIHYLSL